MSLRKDMPSTEQFGISQGETQLQHVELDELEHEVDMMIRAIHMFFFNAYLLRWTDSGVPLGNSVSSLRCLTKQEMQERTQLVPLRVDPKSGHSIFVGLSELDYAYHGGILGFHFVDESGNDLGDCRPILSYALRVKYKQIANTNSYRQILEQVKEDLIDVQDRLISDGIY